mmetsp:Transcript_17004/g.59499  ORF Transcript_17004/g.59499 Transcript_17004/m.59499 type:complete len:223 (+) Transcript_17004:388-1056(+)
MHCLCSQAPLRQQPRRERAGSATAGVPAALGGAVLRAALLGGIDGIGGSGLSWSGGVGQCRRGCLCGCLGALCGCCCWCWWWCCCWFGSCRQGSKLRCKLCRGQRRLRTSIFNTSEGYTQHRHLGHAGCDLQLLQELPSISTLAVHRNHLVASSDLILRLALVPLLDQAVWAQRLHQHTATWAGGDVHAEGLAGAPVELDFELKGGTCGWCRRALSRWQLPH